MSYQNVSSPRFYIDYLSYSRAIGSGGNAVNLHEGEDWGDANLNNLIGLNPSNSINNIPNTGISQDGIRFSFYDEIGNVFKPADIIWIGIFNHNLANPHHYYVFSPEMPEGWDWFLNAQEIVNFPNGFQQDTEYNGWSLFTCLSSFIFHGDIYLRFELDSSQIADIGTVDWDIKLGSIGIGKYYDIKNAPNLSLKLNREYEGIKEFTTYNGSSMSNKFWDSCPLWDDLGAWELGNKDASQTYGGTNPALSRSSRRSWDLTFSYMDDSDLWGPNQSLSTFINTAININPEDFSGQAFYISMISDQNMSTYYARPYDSFSSTPTSFTGTHVSGNMSVATTGLSSSIHGDLDIVGGLAYMVRFHLAIAEGEAPRYNIANHQNHGSGNTNIAYYVDAYEGNNEQIFTATSSDNSGLVRFYHASNTPNSTITVSDLEIFPAEEVTEFAFNDNILTDNNFFSQVWQKTLGGTLPFVFQPDSNNNNPDQFAIARIKEKSLKATQSAHNVYDISLTIEEVW